MDITALFTLSYGVYAVSAFDEANERHTGCIANSVMQITASPATLAVSLNHDNHTNAVIAKGGRFCVSVLSENTAPATIGSLGFRSGRDAAKYTDTPHTLHGGFAVPDGACAYIVCTVIDSMETDTHTVFLARIDDAENLSKNPPMTYAYYHRVIKGKAPKNAPTYVEEKPKEQQWVCTVCGYVYDGDTPFEELPESYCCPLCGALKCAFERR